MNSDPRQRRQPRQRVGAANRNTGLAIKNHWIARLREVSKHPTDLNDDWAWWVHCLAFNVAVVSVMSAVDNGRPDPEFAARYQKAGK